MLFNLDGRRKEKQWVGEEDGLFKHVEDLQSFDEVKQFWLGIWIYCFKRGSVCVAAFCSLDNPAREEKIITVYLHTPQSGPGRE